MADKYSSDDLKDLQKQGKAMPPSTEGADPSYPVADQEDLEKAIKAVGRGAADHDAIRKHIITQAAALKLSDLIPDNWNADGSLKDAETKSRAFAPTTKEERAGDSLSFGDVQSRVYETLIGSLPWPADTWIVDLGADWVVYQDFNAEGLYRLTYSIDDGGLVAFDGPPTRVDQVTSFVPVEQTNDSLPAGESRADDEVTCPKCKGKGTILDGNRECPLCGGDKTVTPAVAEKETKSAGRTRSPRRQRRSLERMPEWRRVNAQFERRVQQEGNDIVLSGIPIAYSSAYQVRDMLGAFRETMHPGVADKAMASRDFDCRFLLNHDGMPMARSVAGTLVFEDTPRGLRCEPHMDARQQSANDLAIAVERGDVTQMSCGFVVADGGDEWRRGSDGVEERDVYSFEDLFDVSAVTYPASPSTSIELAERMLSAAGTETRERIRRLFVIGGAARSKTPLSPKDGEDLRAAAEALCRADAAPLTVQLELHRSVNERLCRALREGKVLSAQNQDDFQAALDALHTTDDVDIPAITAALETIDKALDAGQAALSAVLGRANPDGDAADKNPTLVAATDPASDKDARARQWAQLEIIRSRQLLAV